MDCMGASILIKGMSFLIHLASLSGCACVHLVFSLGSVVLQHGGYW